MVLLGQGAQVKARVGLFGVLLILMQDRCTVLHGTYDMLRNQLGRT